MSVKLVKLVKKFKVSLSEKEYYYEYIDDSENNECWEEIYVKTSNGLEPVTDKHLRERIRAEVEAYDQNHCW